MRVAVWFVLDTLRAFYLSCYGYFRQTSPNMDRLAEEGVLFEHSYASAIGTGPGFTSLYAGLVAIRHGFYLTPRDLANAQLLDDQVPALPELFHLSHCPLELKHRANEAQQTVGELEEKLRRWVERNLADERTDPIYSLDGARTCYIDDKGEY